MTRRSLAVLLVALFVAVAVTAPAAATASQPEIASVEYAGDNPVPGDRESLWLWQSEPHEFEVTLSGVENATDTRVCLVSASVDSNETRDLNCATTDVPENETTTVPVGVEAWPANATGDQQLRVELQTGPDSRVVASSSLSVMVVETDGDLDDDGLSNAREVESGTELRDADTDGDGLDDGIEVDTYGTSPTTADTDGDGLNDGEEVNEHETDPTTADTDGDGLADSQEVELGTNPNRADTDGDGLDDAAEVNTYQTDPSNPDTDGDGLDDGEEVNEYDTDPTVRDTDDDGLADNLEVNTYGTDPQKIDTDSDGLNDGEEVNEYGTDPTSADSDGDGLDDGEEVNEYDTNPTRADTDGDGQSDLAEVREEQSSAVPGWTFGVAAAVVLLVGGSVFAFRSGRVSLTAMRRATPLGGASPGDEPSGSASGREASSPEASGREASTEGEANTVRSDAAQSAVIGETDVPSDGGESGGDATNVSSGSDETATSSGNSASGERAREEIPPEFLSSDKRVLRLLDENDGRVPQSDLVEETGWSKAKTSRVLSEMADDRQVVKIQLGRGNVVALPDAVPPGVDSTDDE